MRLKSNLVAAGAMLVAASVAAAQGQLLKTACDTAEAVVIGTIEPVAVTSPPALFTIAVDTTIKGVLTPGAVVTSAWLGSLTAAKMRPGHYRALWFLSRNGAGMWEISAIGGPNAPLFASGLAIPPAGQGGLTQKPAIGSSCYQAVWDALIPGSAHVDEAPEYLTAMETLLLENPTNMSTASPGYTSTLQAFTQSASVNLNALALAASIRGKDSAALAQVAAQVKRLATSRSSYQIGLALTGWRGTDSRDVASLAALAQANVPGFSEPALQALMMIHTNGAVPSLLNLLKSPDPAIQDAAIRGLSLFVNGAPVLTEDAVKRLAHFTSAENSDYVDSAIAPFISVAPVPAARRVEYVDAWTQWGTRMSAKLNQ